MEALVLGFTSLGSMTFVIEQMLQAPGIGAVEVLLVALEKWNGYLLDRYFKIKTNHFSLKYLLNQKLTTPFQLKWLPKVLGYDNEIVFKKGIDNAAADAL
ncbi:putative mitochondrial protein [Tanacetum coccineum]